MARNCQCCGSDFDLDFDLERDIEGGSTLPVILMTCWPYEIKVGQPNAQQAQQQIDGAHLHISPQWLHYRDLPINVSIYLVNEWKTYSRDRRQVDTVLF